LALAKGKIALREAGSLKASLGLAISPMRSFIPAGLMLVLACLTTSRAQEESGGVLIYHDPLVSYTEAMEYRAFRQDNPLYCTVFTSNGRKQMKSGSVLAVVPYPPSTFEPVFEETAGTALQKIDSLIAAYPQVKAATGNRQTKMVARPCSLSRNHQNPRLPLRVRRVRRQLSLFRRARA
jgi:hypothetical protein